MTEGKNVKGEKIRDILAYGSWIVTLVALIAGQGMAFYYAVIITIFVFIYAVATRIQEKWEQSVVSRKEFATLKADVKKLKKENEELKKIIKKNGGNGMKASIDPRWIILIFILILLYLYLRSNNILP